MRKSHFIKSYPRKGLKVEALSRWRGLCQKGDIFVGAKISAY
nr:MAG TPA: hypothetical protein [Caudoviricetes sp.]